MSIVSVIIPCYNQGQYLAESIGSVLVSDYDDFEIIVVDDGSTDPETCSILDSLNYPRTTLIRQKNSGPSAARNAGISRAAGRYILPLDADDRIGPRYISQAVISLDSDATVGICYCRGEKFGAEHGPITAASFSLARMRFSNLVFCTAMFRKCDWALAGGYCLDMVYGNEDWEFWCSLIELGRKVVRIPEVSFWYRIKEDSRNSLMNRERQLSMHRLIVARHPGMFPWWFPMVLPVYYAVISSLPYRLMKRYGLPGKLFS